MNRKYIDFVPVRPKAPVKKPAPKETIIKEPKPEVKPGPIEEVMVEDILVSDADTFSIKKEPNYGVIEDLHPKFVKTDVEKRPLAPQEPEKESVKDELAEAKAKRISAKKFSNPVEKPVENSEKKEPETEKKEAKLNIPKSPFINQNKVVKRPLSKNVYTREIKPTEETQSGPITIISKPEKDAKVSLIIAIILTIILGAVAGTIAFLLLPK